MGARATGRACRFEQGCCLVATVTGRRVIGLDPSRQWQSQKQKGADGHIALCTKIPSTKTAQRGVYALILVVGMSTHMGGIWIYDARAQ